MQSDRNSDHGTILRYITEVELLKFATRYGLWNEEVKSAWCPNCSWTKWKV
jgi:hypothetical protein